SCRCASSGPPLRTNSCLDRPGCNRAWPPKTKSLPPAGPTRHVFTIASSISQNLPCCSMATGEWRLAKERKSKYENRNSPRKDLTQRAQGAEPRGHREEGKKDSSRTNRS